ncbi:MAG TPA: DUF1800 domain-containing protein [Ktedonobacterales bacterium]|nr:DUF1800 domain-containing protein [Ktedonobacterales bacterium]
MTSPHDPRDSRTPRAPGYDDAPTVIQEPAAPQSPRRRGVSRRAVVIGAAGAAVGLGAIGAGAGYALSRLPSLLTHGDIFSSDAGKVIHLLRRAGFGPSPADLGVYLSLGASGALDRLLNYSGVANDVDQRLAAYNFSFSTRANLVRWWLARMTLTQRPFEEKMTLFWHGVLTSSFAKIGKSVNLPLMIQQNNLLRSHALGRFDDLMLAISTDPAMLYWLDGRFNTGSRPNENYSRELMELFTLGIGNYTQDDVHQGSKALSGWVIRNGAGVFVPGRFYDGTITYLNHTGHLELKDVISIVCAHPATPGHVARRMWSFFVYDNPSASDVQPMIDAYHQSDHQISAMVKAMFTSPAFYSEKAYRARVKSPAEFVVGAVRAMGVTPNIAALTIMGQAMAAMGQTIFDPPNVAGWPGDQMSATWVSTQTWISRVNFINLLLAAATGTRSSGGSHPVTGDAGSSALQQIITAQKLGAAQDVLNYFVALLLDNQLASDRKAIVLDALTSAMTATASNSASGAGGALRLAGGATLPAVALRQALYLLMSMPEYQMN